MDALADFADRHPGNDATAAADWDFLLMNASTTAAAASRETEKRRRTEEGQSKEARKGGGSQIFRRIKTSRPTRTPLTEDECPGGTVRA